MNQETAAFPLKDGESSEVKNIQDSGLVLTSAIELWRETANTTTLTTYSPRFAQHPNPLPLIRDFSRKDSMPNVRTECYTFGAQYLDQEAKNDNGYFVEGDLSAELNK